MKNPYLSLWLSSVNWMLATSRAYANVELKRQAGLAARRVRKAALPGALAPTRKRKTRRR